MESFLNGVLLGYGVCVPLGPVNVMIMTHALSRFSEGFVLGVGAMAVDLLYLVLLLFGLLSFAENEAFLQIITIFGALFLTYIAFLTLKSRPTTQTAVTTASCRLWRCFAKGVVANLLNPFVIIFWLSVAGFAMRQAAPLLSILGLLCAIFSWVFALPFLVSKTRRFITPKSSRVINLVSAILIMFCVGMLVFKSFF